jgi:hypothetical protein
MEIGVFPHRVKVTWKYNENDQYWNDLCAWAIEAFGLPGHRFQFESTEDWMIWRFCDSNDAFLFQLRSGGHQI